MPEVTVAAAANLIGVFQQIGPRFESETGIHPIFSFASTAQLTRQIENAAPFDVFASADAEHIAELDKDGLLAPGSRATYATGILALWSPNSRVTRIEDLTSPEVHVIAIAKPELAPYGQAAVDTLQHLHLWEQIQSKIVYGENINMAKEYGVSHNADAVFTAYSLVLHESGKILPVEEALHQPIRQELGVMANSKHPDAARKFVAFLLTGDGRTLLGSSGYKIPGGR